MIVQPEVSRKASGDDNLIPLINVVFLMLIFFMVAGQIAKSDAVKIEPPHSESNKTSEQTEPVIILVSGESDIYLQNEAVAEGQLTTCLNKLFEQAEDSAAFSILVKVPASLPVTELQTVLKQIKAAGLVKISLATRLMPAEPTSAGAS